MESTSCTLSATIKDNVLYTSVINNIPNDNNDNTDVSDIDVDNYLQMKLNKQNMNNTLINHTPFQLFVQTNAELRDNLDNYFASINTNIIQTRMPNVLYKQGNKLRVCHDDIRDSAIKLFMKQNSFNEKHTVIIENKNKKRSINYVYWDNGELIQYNLRTKQKWQLVVINIPMKLLFHFDGSPAVEICKQYYSDIITLLISGYANNNFDTTMCTEPITTKCLGSFIWTYFDHIDDTFPTLCFYDLIFSTFTIIEPIDMLLINTPLVNGKIIYLNGEKFILNI
jgi:hypothetical protein